MESLITLHQNMAQAKQARPVSKPDNPISDLLRYQYDQLQHVRVKLALRIAGYAAVPSKIGYLKCPLVIDSKESIAKKSRRLPTGPSPIAGRTWEELLEAMRIQCLGFERWGGRG